MRRAVVAISVLLGVAAAPAGAWGQQHAPGHGSPAVGSPTTDSSHTVAIARRAYSPARTSALTGDTVTWRNDELLIHNVSIPAGTIFSGSLERGDRFSHRFETPGSYPFRCTLHPFMTGQVDVHGALLEVDSGSVLSGQPVELHGRAAGGAQVMIERQSAGEADFKPLLTLRADDQGHFRAEILPTHSSSYRAVSEAGTSPVVAVAVASELRIRVDLHRGSRYTRVRVAAPGAGEAVATLQLYSRERFSWKDRERRHLDGKGNAAFRLRPSMRYHARVIVTRPDGDLLATSGRFKLPR